MFSIFLNIAWHFSILEFCIYDFTLDSDIWGAGMKNAAVTVKHRADYMKLCDIFYLQWPEMQTLLGHCRLSIFLFSGISLIACFYPSHTFIAGIWQLIVINQSLIWLCVTDRFWAAWVKTFVTFINCLTSTQTALWSAQFQVYWHRRSYIVSMVSTISNFSIIKASLAKPAPVL